MSWNDRILRGIGPRLLANFIIYTAIVLGIVALVNWFVNRHNRRWDLTPNQSYSLSDQSRRLLKELNQDVTIYVFDRERAFRERRDLLGNYSAATHRISIRYVDPDRQPSLAKQFNVRTYGTIVLASGDRHLEAQSASEEGVTNALIRLLKGQKTACFIQGHGERDIENTENSGYDRIRKQLESESYVVKTHLLMQKLEIPSDCSLVIVAGPRNDFLAAEVEAIKKYVSEGGRLLMLLDPGVVLENLAKLLSEWNVTLRNDIVIDLNPIAQIFGAEPAMPLIIKYGSSPIVRPLARVATLFPYSRSLAVGANSKAGVTAESLCETSSDSYGVADFDPRARRLSVRYREGKDFKGPLSLAVAGSVRGEGEKKAEGRFVVTGSSSLAANAYLGFQGNRDLVMNMANWLSAAEDLISVRPKPPQTHQLNLTTSHMRRIFYLGVLGMPGLVVLAGVAVWWRHR